MIAAPLRIHPLLHIVGHIRPRDAQEILAVRRDHDLVEWANEAVNFPGNHFIFASDAGEPIAAGGWIDGPVSHAVQSWLIATDRIGSIADGLHRFAVRSHRALVGVGVKRFCTIGVVGYEDGCRWLKHLGYVQEGIMRKAGRSGEDLYVAARVEA